MKKLYYLLLVLPVLVKAQSYDQNFVKTTTYKTATTTSVTNPSASVATVQVNYMDGLGRPIQQIGVKQSNSGKDIITPIEYDAYGRQPKEYLPYIGDVLSLTFDSNAQAKVSSFYGTPNVSQNGNPTFEATQNPYSQKQFEASPLNRVLKQAAPGNAWVLNGGHDIKIDYRTILEGEVRLFRVSNSWNAANLVYDINLIDNGTYAANELYKTTAKDENWESGLNNTTEEFKDKEGRVILKRTYNSSTPHDTYYVYDSFSNLTYVIPPKVTGGVTTDVLDGLCYQYKYDYRNRLAEKKLPGKQWEFIVYDKLNKPVATGPAYSPYGNGASGVMVTQYDAFSRPIARGWKGISINSSQRGSLQAQINSNSNPLALVDAELLTKNYYDNYTFPGAPTPIPTTIEGQNIATNVRGLATGSWARVLTAVANNTMEVSYSIYDYKYRPVRTYTKNYLGGYTQTDTKLDFAGTPQHTITTHKRTANDTELKTTDRFTYSAQGRFLIHTHQIGIGTVQLLSKNQYDELGQLIEKKVGGTDVNGNTALQTVDYSYNIRGWLTGINNSNSLVQTGQPVDLFAFKLNYNSPDTAKPLYNGNISETYWRTNNDNTLRKYSNQYDDLNRLLNATYAKPGVSTNNSYGELLSYDKNGNIMTLQRNGLSDGTLEVYPIDNLIYTYPTNSNQLSKVDDIPNNNQNGFKDGANTNADYGYDGYGNMTSDQNKGIASIAYNHLNLPVKIVFENNESKKIEYLYNAIGIKVLKKVTDGAVVTTTDYLSGYQYRNSQLQFFPTAEGYFKQNQGAGVGTGSYVFNYTDHLGNVRVSYIVTNNVLNILEENNYYPFGMKHSPYNESLPTSYKYKYNGKELQDELGLNWYDYGWRNYDPALGRWMNIDPLAETSRRFSPYVYALNNPIYFIDVDGMYAADPGDYYSKNGKHLGNDGVNDNKVYVADSKNKDGTFNNSTELSVTHDEFATSANVVKHESSGNKDESLWIAHAANNAKDNNAIDYKKQNETLNDQLTDQKYSTTPSSARTPLADTDASSSANNARAAVIDVLSGKADPTGGAVLWDGSDFLSKGASHNKFKEFKSIDIDAGSLNTYSSAQKGTPNSIFSSAINNNTSFSASGKNGRTYSLQSTGAEGKSIFWKIKK
jgi:RHS repeat-associated protein